MLHFASYIQGQNVLLFIKVQIYIKAVLLFCEREKNTDLGI